jgi:hypothetical protein
MGVQRKYINIAWNLYRKRISTLTTPQKQLKITGSKQISMQCDAKGAIMSKNNNSEQEQDTVMHRHHNHLDFTPSKGKKWFLGRS